MSASFRIRTLAATALLILVSQPGLASETKPIEQSTTLPEPVQSVLKAHELPESSLSIFIQDVQASRPLLTWNPDTPRNPASVMKLVTTLAALEELGPGHRWKTRAFATEPVVAGKLEGNLYLQGGGDPYIVTESFWRFLRELRNKGLVHINGDLVVDNSLFEPVREDPGEFDGEPYRSYNVLPRALLLNFYTTRFAFRPDSEAQRVIITPDPPLTTLQIDNDLRLTNGFCEYHLNRIRMDVAATGSGDTVRFRGTYPAECGEFSLDRVVSSPLPYIYGVFDALWREMGGSIDGGVRAGVVPKRARPLHSMQSLTLAEVVRAINKHSNNVMTRSLLLSIGAEFYGEPGTMEKGRNAVHSWLVKKGIPGDGLVMDNGSGRSREARVTASMLGELLLGAYRGPLMPEFVSSLPLSGVDGTMRLRFRRGPIAERAHLKTGVIDDVNAIAGYLMAGSGRTYVLVAVQNHPGVHRGFGRQVQDALLEWLHEH